MITQSLLGLAVTLPGWVLLVGGAWVLWACYCAGPWPWGCAAAVGIYGGTHDWPLDLSVLAAVAAFVVIYFLRCWQDPHTPCWWCKGKSRRMNAEGHFHFCWVCHGSGKRDRFGAIVMGKAGNRGD